MRNKETERTGGIVQNFDATIVRQITSLFGTKEMEGTIVTQITSLFGTKQMEGTIVTQLTSLFGTKQMEEKIRADEQLSNNTHEVIPAEAAVESVAGFLWL